MQVENLHDRLVRRKGQQVGHVLAPGVARRVGQLVRLRAVDPALVGEKQDPVMGGGDEEVLHEVVLAQGRTAHPSATAPLRAIQPPQGSLCISAAGDRDDHILLGDEVFH
jgi:hypothetical protein